MNVSTERCDGLINDYRAYYCTFWKFWVHLWGQVFLFAPDVFTNSWRGDGKVAVNFLSVFQI